MSGAKMTAKERVLKVYPKAECRYTLYRHGTYAVSIPNKFYPLAMADDEETAWRSAAESLKGQRDA